MTNTIKKYRVYISSQWRDFDNQKEAREFAVQVLQVPIYFVELKEVEVKK